MNVIYRNEKSPKKRWRKANLIKYSRERAKRVYITLGELGACVWVCVRAVKRALARTELGQRLHIFAAYKASQQVRKTSVRTSCSSQKNIEIVLKVELARVRLCDGPKEKY